LDRGQVRAIHFNNFTVHVSKVFVFSFYSVTAFVSILVASFILFLVILLSICCCCPCCWIAQMNERKKMKAEVERMRIQSAIHQENMASSTQVTGVQSTPMSRPVSPPPLSPTSAAVVVTETHVYPSTNAGFDEINLAPQPQPQIHNPPPYEYVSDRHQQSLSSRMTKAKDKTVDVVILAKDKTTGAVKSLGTSLTKNRSQPEKTDLEALWLAMRHTPIRITMGMMVVWWNDGRKLQINIMGNKTHKQYIQIHFVILVFNSSLWSGHYCWGCVKIWVITKLIYVCTFYTYWSYNLLLIVMLVNSKCILLISYQLENFKYPIDNQNYLLHINATSQPPKVWR